MKQQKIILLLALVTMALVMFLSTNIGYASVETYRGDDIITSPEKANFRVRFIGTPTYTGDGKAYIRITSDTTARMNVTGLSKAGDSVTAIFKIKNESHSLAAELSEIAKNTNKEYFKVTASLSKNRISARNGEAVLSVKVELIKTPINRVEATYINVNVIAEAID